jgi:hypothetical protein
LFLAHDIEGGENDEAELDYLMKTMMLTDVEPVGKLSFEMPLSFVAMTV